MSEYERLDLRIKHLTKVEAEYRTTIKRAQHDMRDEPEKKTRYERVVKKYQRKIDKLIPKVRRLRELRTRLR